MGFADAFLRGHEAGRRVAEGKRRAEQEDEEFKLRKQEHQQRGKIMEAEQLIRKRDAEQKNIEFTRGLLQSGAAVPDEQRTVDVNGVKITLPTRADTKALELTEFGQQEAAKKEASRVSIDNEAAARALGLAPGERVSPETITAATGLKTRENAAAISAADNAAAVKAAGVRATATTTAAETRAAAAAANPDKVASRTMRLQSNFQRDTKDFQGFLSTAQKITALASEKTASGDQAMVQSFIHNMDNSTARESEVTAFMAAQGIPGRLQRWQGEITGGGRLSDKSRAEIVAATNSLRAVGMKSFAARKTQYEDMATDFGVNPQHVTGGVDLGGADVVAAAEIPTFTSKAQYDAAPSGTVFMRNGKKLRKP